MNELWQILLTAVGGSAVLLLAVGFLVKNLISHLLSKDVECFKAEIQHGATVQLERTLSDLRQTALEREVRFRQLHEKRSLVIAELYARIVATVDKFEYAFEPIEWFGQPSREAKMKEAMPSMLELREYFERNRILFPEALADQIHAFIEKLGGWWHEYRIWSTMADQDEIAKKSQNAAIVAAWKGIRNEVPGLRRELEQEFRKLL
jgi:hypothetical protein